MAYKKQTLNLLSRVRYQICQYTLLVVKNPPCLGVILVEIPPFSTTCCGEGARRADEGGGEGAQ